MKILVVILVLVMAVTGCTTTLTPGEIADREIRDLTTRELYHQCQALYSAEGIVNWLRPGAGRLPPTPTQMRLELAYNHCPKELL